jgi:hypothetical protein
MPTRSESTEYAKALAQKRRVEAEANKNLDTSSDSFEIEMSDKKRAQREAPKARKKLDRVSKETGYDFPDETYMSNSRGESGTTAMSDRLSRSGNEYSSGMSEGEYAAEDDTEPNPRPVSQYRKGGMVKKKSSGAVKMKSGGSVRGAGIAQRGKGKMRMC